LSADAEAEKTRQAVFGSPESDTQDDVFSVEDRADLEDAIRGRHTRQVYLKKLRAASKKAKEERARDLRAAAQKPEELILETKQGECEDETPTEEPVERAQDAEESPEPLDEKTQ
jgi:hypothetical protein